MLDFILHPIVIGIIVAVVSYIVMRYLYIDTEDSNDNCKESPSLMYPLVLGAFSWFFAYCYFECYRPHAIAPKIVDLQPTAVISANDIKMPLEVSQMSSIPPVNPAAFVWS